MSLFLDLEKKGDSFWQYNHGYIAKINCKIFALKRMCFINKTIDKFTIKVGNVIDNIFAERPGFSQTFVYWALGLHVCYQRLKKYQVRSYANKDRRFYCTSYFTFTMRRNLAKTFSVLKFWIDLLNFSLKNIWQTVKINFCLSLLKIGTPKD